MKSKLKKLNGTRRKLTIEMPKESVDEAFEAVFENIKNTAKLPGFRPGKVPMDIVRARFVPEATDRVKESIIPEAYQRALDEHDLSPVSYPSVSDVALSEAGTLSFTAEVDTHPEVKLKNYKGLKFVKTERKVTEEEVSKAVERIKDMNPDFEDRQGPLEKGDYAICDVETFSDGQRVSEKRKDMWIEVDKEASMLGMGENLEGLEKGATTEISSVLPENYPDKKYAGKDVLFKVQVNQTKIKKRPAEGPELAEKVGKKDMAELREEIRSQLAERKDMNAQVELKNSLMETLLKKHDIDLPPTMVERQKEALIKRAKEDLARKGVAEDAFEEHREKLDSQLQKEAENKVALYFILDAIAEQEGIEVTDDEVDAWLKNLGENYGQSLEDVKKYYEERGLIGGLIEQLREEKTIEYLLEESQVTVKPE